MLTKCPECDLNVSSKAVFCPHCGYPFEPKKITTKNSNRRRRLPNGFGQITELKGRNLRKPFRAMVTIGKDEAGRPICKLLKPNGYFNTYNEAYSALIEYHQKPHTVKSNITMDEYFNQWKTRQINLVKCDGAQTLLTSTWKYCAPLHNIKVKDITMVDVENILKSSSVVYRGKTVEATINVKKRIKTLLSQMFETAIVDGIATQNFAKHIQIKAEDTPDEAPPDLDNISEGKHICFSDDEMSTLWENVDKVPYVDIMLINCYLGMRPQELGLIKLVNIDMENWIIIGGLKTASGKHRLIPVHTRIRPYVQRWYDRAVEVGSEYLFYNIVRGNVTTLTYNAYRYNMNKVKKKLELNPEHKPHDCRVQFVTMAKHAGVSDYAIKRVAGHQISDVTESVYTKRSFEEIRAEIEKIK